MIKRKKSIAVLLTLAMALTMTGVNFKTAYAGEYTSMISYGLDSNFATDSNGLTWLYHKYDDGTIGVDGVYKLEYENGVNVGSKGDELKSVVEIPAILDGYKVSCVEGIVGYENMHSDDYGKIGKPVQKVVIPEGIKEIGRGAFARCPNLTDINIPSSVNIIGSGAFTEQWLNSHRDSNGFVVINGILVDGHKASGYVTIPDNIRCIGDGAFAYTSNTDGSFADYENITGVTIPSSVKRIGKYAFSGCNLTKAVISEGVEVIDEKAFACCKQLTEAKVPSSVTELSNYAFYGDDNLQSTTENSNGLIISNGTLLKGNDAKGDVVIPSNVTSIQEGAFSENKNITSIKIPGGVKEIPGNAFAQCTNLKSVTIEDGVEIIGQSAFESTGINEINLPSSIKKIGSFSFSGCGNLYKVNYNEGTDVGLDAFSMTPWLNSLNYGSFSIYKGVLLRYNSDGRNEVIIPDGVKVIAGGAFSAGLANEDIKSVKIPEGVTKIGEFAFSECRNLSDLCVPSTLKTIEYGAFDFCDSIGFSGPGADIAKYELDNQYPTAKGENTGSSNIQNSQVNNSIETMTGQGDNLQSNKIKCGWNYIENNWYYGNSDGSMKTGWLYDSGFWYYFYGNGQMATAFINLNGAYYYLNPYSEGNQGAMKVGWQKINGYWYYFNPVSDSFGYEGMMAKSSWRYINGVWYYFYSDGTMAHDTWIENYYVDSNGAWIY